MSETETKTEAAVEPEVTVETAAEAPRFVEKDPVSHVSENDTFEPVEAPEMGTVQAPKRRTDPTPHVAAYTARKTTDHTSAVYGKPARDE